jgi:anti-anti-sigma regulatory factor
LSTGPIEIGVPVERCGDHAVIRPEGYLNALIGDRIDKACAELIGEGICYFIINFSGISTVNTIGISILVGIIEKAVENDGLVYFTDLGMTDRQIFEVLNLTTVAMVFATDEEAREHLSRDREAAARAAQS